MTGQGVSPRPTALETILLNALTRLATLEGLNVKEIAARCILAGQTPTVPAFSREVVETYQTLEQDMTRGPVSA
jgi:hypothetical protein